jgi:hypothetical protein
MKKIYIKMDEFFKLSIRKRVKLAKLMGFEAKQGFLCLGEYVILDTKAWETIQ